MVYRSHHVIRENFAGSLEAFPLRDDEKALIESAKKYASELEQIFQQDEKRRRPS